MGKRKTLESHLTEALEKELEKDAGINEEPVEKELQPEVERNYKRFLIPWDL